MHLLNWFRFFFLHCSRFHHFTVAFRLSACITPVGELLGLLVLPLPVSSSLSPHVVDRGRVTDQVQQLTQL